MQATRDSEDLEQYYTSHPAIKEAREADKEALDFALHQPFAQWKGFVKAREHLTHKSHDRFREKARSVWDQAEEARLEAARVEGRARRLGPRAARLELIQGKQTPTTDDQRAELDFLSEEHARWKLDRDQAELEAWKEAQEAEKRRSWVVSRALMGVSEASSRIAGGETVDA